MCKRKVFQADRTTKVKARRWECVQLFLEWWGHWGWSERRKGRLVEEKMAAQWGGGGSDGSGWFSSLAFTLCEMGATSGVWAQNWHCLCFNRFILAASWKWTTREVRIEAGGKLVERGPVDSNSGGTGEEWSDRFMLGLFWSESNRISWCTAWREKGERRISPRLLAASSSHWKSTFTITWDEKGCGYKKAFGERGWTYFGQTDFERSVPSGLAMQVVGQAILECGREVWLEFTLEASRRLSGLA